MCGIMAMKRNDIVIYKTGGFYGRVISIVGNKAFWICSGKHFHLTDIDLLEVHDYKGSWEWSADGPVMKYWKKAKCGLPTYELKFERPLRFYRMPTLRKLKQKASKYHGRKVWKTPLDYGFIKGIDE